MNIGIKILELREKNNMSQQELADTIEVSRQTVSKWECGNCDPEVNKIVKLANVFKVTTDYLLDNVVASDNSKEDKVKDLHKLYNYQKQVVEKYYLNNPEFKQSENRLIVSQPHCEIILDIKKINNDTLFIPSIVDKVSLSSNYQGLGLKIEIEDKIDNLHKIFNGRTISTIDVSSLDVRKLRSLEGLFYGIKSVNLIKGLDKLDLSNHKSFKQLFSHSTITTIEGVNNIDVSNIEDFTCAFSNCKIEKLDISNWNISKMKTASRTKENSLPISSYIFHRAVIDDLNVSNWDLSNVKHVIAWFAAAKINNLHDITKWNMSGVVDASGLFNSAIIKQTADLTKLKISSNCDTTGMFELYKN